VLSKNSFQSSKLRGRSEFGEQYFYRLREKYFKFFRVVNLSELKCKDLLKQVSAIVLN